MVRGKIEEYLRLYGIGVLELIYQEAVVALSDVADELPPGCRVLLQQIPQIEEIIAEAQLAFFPELRGDLRVRRREEAGRRGDAVLGERLCEEGIRVGIRIDLVPGDLSALAVVRFEDILPARTELVHPRLELLYDAQLSQLFQGAQHGGDVAVPTVEQGASGTAKRLHRADGILRLVRHDLLVRAYILQDIYEALPAGPEELVRPFIGNSGVSETRVPRAREELHPADEGLLRLVEAALEELALFPELAGRVTALDARELPAVEAGHLLIRDHLRRGRDLRLHGVLGEYHIAEGVYRPHEAEVDVLAGFPRERAGGFGELPLEAGVELRRRRLGEGYSADTADVHAFLDHLHHAVDEHRGLARTRSGRHEEAVSDIPAYPVSGRSVDIDIRHRKPPFPRHRRKRLPRPRTGPSPDPRRYPRSRSSGSFQNRRRDPCGTPLSARRA